MISSVWNRIASAYGASLGGDDDCFYRRLAPLLHTETGDDLEGRRVLDLGCGHGWLEARLAAAGADVLGVEGSQALIRQAKTAHPELTWQVHNLTERIRDSWGGSTSSSPTLCWYFVPLRPLTGYRLDGEALGGVPTGAGLTADSSRRASSSG